MQREKTKKKKPKKMEEKEEGTEVKRATTLLTNELLEAEKLVAYYNEKLFKSIYFEYNRKKSKNKVAEFVAKIISREAVDGNTNYFVVVDTAAKRLYSGFIGDSNKGVPLAEVKNKFRHLMVKMSGAGIGKLYLKGSDLDNEN